MPDARRCHWTPHPGIVFELVAEQCRAGTVTGAGATTDDLLRKA